jgi:hypothetical protein
LSHIGHDALIVQRVVPSPGPSKSQMQFIASAVIKEIERRERTAERKKSPDAKPGLKVAGSNEETLKSK